MSDTEHRKNIRTDLVERLYAELIGPKPDSPESDQNEELEASPLSLYGAAILFPKKAVQNLMEDTSTPVQDNVVAVLNLDDAIKVDTGVRSPNASSDDVKEDPPLNLAATSSATSPANSFQ